MTRSINPNPFVLLRLVALLTVCSFGVSTHAQARRPFSATKAPKSWKCSAALYAQKASTAAASCNCGCGAPDPDCQSLACSVGSPFCVQGVCVELNNFNKALHSCKKEDLKLATPIEGKVSQDWIVKNYYDHDKGNKTLKDYTGAVGASAKTYDGHIGIDYRARSLRSIDEKQHVVAAAAGVVINLGNSVSFDRSTETTFKYPAFAFDPYHFNSGEGNFVTVRHKNGFKTRYVHNAYGSVLVKKGDVVAEGQQLAVVGSSGKSTSAHLHFEVKDCDDKPLDPFKHGLFKTPAPYNPPLGLLELALQRGNVDLPFHAQDPGPQLVQLQPGERLGLTAIIAGGRGKKVHFELRAPGKKSATHARTVKADAKAQTEPVFQEWLVHKPGIWHLRVSELKPGYSKASWPKLADQYFLVKHLGADKQVVTLGPLPSSHFLKQYKTKLTLGYQPVWIDVFETTGSPLIVAVMDRDHKVERRAYFDLAMNALLPLIGQRGVRGFVPVRVESYFKGNQKRFAVLLERRAGANYAIEVRNHSMAKPDPRYHFVVARLVRKNKWVKQRVMMEAAGFRPISLSAIVDSQNRYYVTTVWVRIKSCPAKFSCAGLSNIAYGYSYPAKSLAAKMAYHKKKGRFLTYVDGWNRQGMGRVAYIASGWNPGWTKTLYGVSQVELKGMLGGLSKPYSNRVQFTGYRDQGTYRYIGLRK